MADEIKISGLPSATTTTGADYVPIVQGGITKKAPLNVLGTGAGIAEVSSSGLVAHWSMDSVPEIPDAPSPDTTYLQDAWATVDGWNGGGGGATSFGSGNLVFTHTGANQYATKSLSFASGTLKLKVRLVSGTLGGNSNNLWVQANFGGIAAVSRTIATDGSWSIVDVYFPSSVTSLQFFGGISGLSFSSNYVLEIDWIYIGTGAYLPNSLIDNSGNGNHGTIYGATPVEGISGKALAFDGVNDRVETALTLENSSAISVSYWIKPAVVDSSLRIHVAKTNSRPWVGISLGNKFVVGSFLADKVTGGPIVAGTTTPVAGTNYFVTFTHDGTTLKLYVNGVLEASSAQTLGITSSVFWIGAYTGIASLASGTIDEPRIYNRALSAEEVYSLYMSKGRGPDCHVKSVAPLKDSLVVRDPSGNIQANGFKFPGTQVASTDPNTLDDFEEGTFTPGMTIGGVAMTTYGANNAGKYTKIGGMVSFSLSLHVTNKGAGSGAAVITGLPFTNGSGQANYTPVSIHASGIAFSGFLQGHADVSATTLTIRQITDAGVLTAIQGSALTVPFTLLVSGNYYV